ncbi:uncharacterized protein LOC143266413 [Megachile rotundata]|uniref:uncharacterized protein LOC143266413 n=1 Tax=Megachile rotundata TaxID=143995 RepID=UPI003FCF58C9
MRCREASKSTYVQNDLFSEVEEAYLDAAAKIDQLVEELPNAGAAGGAPNPLSILSQPHLPKIQLPTFSGNPLEWESFRDLFRSLVHDVPHLSNTKKLLYLKSSLSGEALEVIQNTPITEAGYEGAWEDLEVRYGNTRLLSFAHHRAILTCPPAQRQSTSELKRLLDTFRQTIRAYSALKKPVTAWDEWFMFLLSQKLDRTTHLAWETSLAKSREIPSFQQLADFLENRIQALDAAQIPESLIRSSPQVKDVAPKIKGESSVKKTHSTIYAASAKNLTSRKCLSCSGTHNISYCTKFKALSASKRKDRAIQLKACLNCLNAGHEMAKCPSQQGCLACGKRHHTLLHEAMLLPGSTVSHASTVQRPSEDEDLFRATTCTSSATNRGIALLATARVKVEAPSGDSIEIRALLDTGSDTSLVSQWVVQTLRLPRRAVQVAISGVQDREAGAATSEVQFSVRSKLQKDFTLPVRALVLQRLTSLIPSQQMDNTNWHHLRGVTLADPGFGTPSRVDLILGADVCGALFLDQTRSGQPGTPVGKLTPFGWVLLGPTSRRQAGIGSVARTYHCHCDDTTEQLLQRFWEVEELPNRSPLSPEEENCERHFKDTHSRDESGRYCVRLPFKQDPSSALTSTRAMALKFLLSCERRLASNSQLAEGYRAFMGEYLDLDHMEPVMDLEKKTNAYYLPHHAVVKRHDPSAKLRVVFNASFPTSTGNSLNDCLCTGPKLQADLWLVLTRWRLFRNVFTSDIVKMYRQIRVHTLDRQWQRILWRKNPDEPVQDYDLSTVTYGTSCAPFLALRVLQQLAEDEKGRFPSGAIVIKRHTYVDDILAGADDEGLLQELKKEVVAIFEAGAFHLAKWASNTPSLQEKGQSKECLFQEASGIGTLGVLWSPKTDSFSLRVNLPANPSARYTKRRILSEVASLFDPLGWAALVLIFAKVLMQDLWILGVEWDQDLPQKLQTSWVDPFYEWPSRARVAWLLRRVSKGLRGCCLLASGPGRSYFHYVIGGQNQSGTGENNKHSALGTLRGGPPGQADRPSEARTRHTCSHNSMDGFHGDAALDKGPRISLEAICGSSSGVSPILRLP